MSQVLENMLISQYMAYVFFFVKEKESSLLWGKI